MGGADAVFVKAVCLPCAAVVVPGAMAGGVEFPDTGLGGDGRGIEDRVLVLEGVEDLFLRNFLGWIDGDEVIGLLGYALEGIHPVVGGVVSLLADAVVPGGPRAFCAGHEFRVCVDYCGVWLVVKILENAVLEGGGGCQEAERLVRVGGEDDFVERMRAAVVEDEAFFEDGADGVVFDNPVSEGGGDFFYILSGASGDCAPWVLCIQAEEAVIMPEAHESAGGKVLDALWRGRPDGGCHGGEIPLKHIGSVAALFNVLDEGEVPERRVCEFIDGLFVKSIDLEEHFPESWREKVFPLGEEEVERAAVEFDTIAEVLNAEGHGGGFRLHC